MTSDHPHPHPRAHRAAGASPGAKERACQLRPAESSSSEALGVGLGPLGPPPSSPPSFEALRLRGASSFETVAPTAAPAGTAATGVLPRASGESLRAAAAAAAAVTARGEVTAPRCSASVAGEGLPLLGTRPPKTIAYRRDPSPECRNMAERLVMAPRWPAPTALHGGHSERLRRRKQPQASPLAQGRQVMRSAPRANLLHLGPRPCAPCSARPA